jgi:O-antigen/teichoic acid export membrane protein
VAAPAPGEDGLATRPLLRGAYSLAAATALGAALGFLFWAAAARLYSPQELGRDTVLISAMIELSTLCQLNLSNGIVRFLPALGAAAPRMLARAYLAAVAAALAIGTGFVLLAPRVSPAFAFLGADPGLQLAFVAALALWGIFVLQDAALTATRRTPWIPLENGAFGALKIAALLVLAGLGTAHGIFLAWALPMAALLAPVSWFLFARALPARTREGAPDHGPWAGLGRRAAAGFLATDYLAQVFTQATLTTLPVLVLALLGAEASAWFAIPFTIALAFDTLAYGSCAALVAEASLAHRGPAAPARIFARRVLGPLVAAALALIAAAPLLLGVFGPSYAAHGTDVLRLLLAASLLRLGLALFGALARIGGHARRIAAVEALLLLVALGAAIPLAHSDGIEGVALAWLLANLLAALYVLPSLRLALRHG